MFNQGCCDDKIAALVFGIAVACTTAVGTTKEPEACQDEFSWSTRCSSRIVRPNIPPRIDPHRSQVQNVDLRTRRTEECWHTRPRENVRPAGHVADEISRSRFKRRDISHFQRNFAEGYNKRLRGKARRPFLKGPVFLAKGHVVSS